MNFALLGEDRDILPLVEALAASAAHRLTHVALVHEYLTRIVSLFPSVHVCDDWDALTAAQGIDVLLVAGDDPAVLEGAKRLAAEGKSLAVFPLATQGPSWVYELSLIRDGTRKPMLPLFCLRLAPTVAQLKRQLESGRVGTLKLMQLRRRWHAAAVDGATPALERVRVDRAFLNDADLLRFLGGDYNQVTALHSGSTEDAVALALVKLGGSGLPEANWSCEGTTDDSGFDLIISGDKGKLTLIGTGEELSDLVLRVDASAATADAVRQSVPSVGDSRELGTAALQFVEAAVAGIVPSPNWADAARAIDIFEAANRSHYRKRTIELYFEATSERSLFKTQMTAVGCALLFLTLLAVMAVMAAGTLLDPREPSQAAAERAGAVFHDEDFEPGTAVLTAEGLKRIDRVRARLMSDSFPVLIEQAGDSPDSPLNRARRDLAIEKLQDRKGPQSDTRVFVAPLRGEAFARTIRIARMAVFVPLLLFLLFQVLLVFARPASAGPGKPNV